MWMCSNNNTLSDSVKLSDWTHCNLKLVKHSLQNKIYMSVLVSKSPSFKELQYENHSAVDYNSLLSHINLHYKDGSRQFTSELFLWSCAWGNPWLRSLLLTLQGHLSVIDDGYLVQVMIDCFMVMSEQKQVRVTKHVQLNCAH